MESVSWEQLENMETKMQKYNYYIQSSIVTQGIHDLRIKKLESSVNFDVIEDILKNPGLC